MNCYSGSRRTIKLYVIRNISNSVLVFKVEWNVIGLLEEEISRYVYLFIVGIGNLNFILNFRRFNLMMFVY